MKKTAITLAVAAALAASAAVQAETTLYGSARVSVDYVTQDLRDTLEDEELDGVWDVFNNSSRLGIRGSEDLGNGLSAIYQYEFGVNVTDCGNTAGCFNANRPKLVGLKGGFGTVAIGTQWSPYYNVVGITDVFNSSKSFVNYLGPFRLSNTVAYVSPSFAGFEVQAALVMDAATVNEDDIDAWNVSGLYKNGPFTAGATYLAIEGDDDVETDQWGVGLGYTGGNLGVALSYENADEDDVDLNDIYGVVSYSFGANIIRAAYGWNELEVDEGDEAEVDHYLLGYQYNFSQRTRVWVEYIGFDGEGDAGDQDAISVGMRHDF